MSALLCAGAAIGLAPGCLVVNTQHCGYTENGADNPCPDGFVCSVCAADNNGCVPIDQKDNIAASCLAGGTTGSTTMTTSPTDGPTTQAPTTETTGTSTGTTLTTMTLTMGVTETDTDTTSTSTTMTSSTTMPIECDPDMIVNDQCTPLYCLPSGTCGSCEDLPQGVTCETLDPAKKVCNTDKGWCMECTAEDISACTVDEPVCNPDSGQCTKCTEHFECPTDACDIETGQCFPPEHVYYVKGALSCPGALGTLDNPFCNLNQIELVPGVPTTIKIVAGGSAPPGFLDVPDGMVIAVVRHANQTPDLYGGNNNVPTITVTGPNSRVYLSWLKFSLAQASSILKCQSQGTLYAYDTRVEGNGMNSARAIDSGGCKLRVRRSVLKDSGAGILANGGDVAVESSYLFGNGNNLSFGAFNFVNGVKARILYSTVVANKATNTASTFTCTGVGQDIVVRNSAVVGLAPLTKDCSIIEEGGETWEAMDAGDQTTVMGQWFTAKPVDLYAPKNSMGLDPLEDQAMWGSGDPVLDYDRTPIPTDVPTFAGADQPPMN